MGSKMKKVGLIDYYLHEWHADNMPGWIFEASGGKMKVCYAWGEIDSPIEERISNREWAEKNDIELCATQEELIEKSDYLVVLSPDNAERHEDLCKLPLASGKSTYVDKTFAAGLDDAKRIVANANNTSFFSTSALRYDTELQSVEKAGIEAVDCRGPGQFETYSIHMLEPLYILMGKAKRVLALGGSSSPTLLYDYGQNRRAVLGFFEGNAGFSTAIRYEDGSDSVVTFKSDFFKAFALDLVRFFETGKPSVSIKDTLEIMSMLDAGRKATEDCGVWMSIE